MIYHIYLYTPPHQLSTYIPHLIEHVVLWGITNSVEYFESLKFSAENYTYYTCFTIDAANKQDLVSFCNRITRPLSKKVIKYEKEVLRQELHYPQYTQRLIDRIWKKLFWKSFQYSKGGQYSHSAVIEYHSQFYQLNKILVAEKDLMFRAVTCVLLCYNTPFHISIQWGNEMVFIATHSAIWLFINEILQRLFDEYLHFSARYIDWKYHTSEVIAWEFDDHLFLAINKVDMVSITGISKAFINAFIVHELNNLSHGNYLDIDALTMLKYGYCIDENSKREVIERLNEQVESIKELLMKKN